jgi:hypothetical protein
MRTKTMKTKTIISAGSIVFPLLFLMLFASTSWAQTSDKSILNIDEQRFHRRAVEAAYWGMPTVNIWAMREGFKRDAGVTANSVLYFSKPQDWHLGITTPNNSTLYIMSFWNTQKDGPIVVDIPPTTKDVGLFGTAMDAWQRPLIDMGGAGYDKGLGAKYLFMPPGYQEIPPKGYVPIPSTNNNGWFLLRTLLKDFSKENLKKGEAFIKQIKVYPLSKANKPPKTKYVDGYGVDMNGIAPYDDTFFDALNTMVQEEPVADQDLVAMGMLKSIGIEKGQPFKPSKQQRAMLKTAANQAHEEFMDLVINTADPYWPKSSWSYLLIPEVVQQTGFSFKFPSYLDYSYRAQVYFSAFSSVVIYGTSTQYLLAGKDNTGARLDGGAKYTLNVPANVPVKQFWSVVVYDLKTAGFVRNTPKAGVTSLDKGLKTNSDGSVDIYFGPKAPAGKDANWAPTVAGHDYFLLFRFYGPTQSLFDKSYKLPDLRQVK